VTRPIRRSQCLNKLFDEGSCLLRVSLIYVGREDWGIQVYYFLLRAGLDDIPDIPL
jgi:hypothetical protein